MVAARGAGLLIGVVGCELAVGQPVVGVAVLTEHREDREHVAPVDVGRRDPRLRSGAVEVGEPFELRAREGSRWERGSYCCSPGSLAAASSSCLVASVAFV